MLCEIFIRRYPTFGKLISSISSDNVFNEEHWAYRFQRFRFEDPRRVCFSYFHTARCIAYIFIFSSQRCYSRVNSRRYNYRCRRNDRFFSLIVQANAPNARNARDQQHREKKKRKRKIEKKKKKRDWNLLL